MVYTYEAPLSYTINVTVAQTPAGIADYNTNSIALFTNEKAGFSDAYKAYISPTADVDFGTNSLTARMVNAMFTPAPNLRTGGGIVYVFPFSGVNATSGTLTTEDLTDNLENFQSVTNGVLNLTIDGVQTEIEGLNFSSVQTVEDIVNVLKSQNIDVYIEAVGNTVKFTSRTFGTSSAVTISTATSAGSATDLSGADYFNGTAATPTTGTNASGQTLAEAVAAAKQQVYFGGVVSTQYCDNATIEANAQAISSVDCIYYETFNSIANIAALGGAIKSAGLSKTRLLCYTLGADESKLAIATYATTAKSVNWDGSDTAITMNLKTLTGVAPDTGLSDNALLSAQQNGVDLYVNQGGVSVVLSNSNNGYTDDVEYILWLKKTLEVTGFNYLRQTNTKIPQTEVAMTGFRNALSQVFEQSIRNGAIAPNVWNNSIPFGDPETFKRNIEETGYYLYSIPVSKQSQTDREARKAPVVQTAAKGSGAIHFADVIVNYQQ